PSHVTLEYRAADVKTNTELLRATTMTFRSGERLEVAVGQLVAAKGDLEFRAVGGDDKQMPWRRLEVVPPPAVDRLQVTLTPPAYAGRAAERLPEGVGHVEGLVGTHVEIVAHAAQPLARAELRVKDQPGRDVKL